MSAVPNNGESLLMAMELSNSSWKLAFGWQGRVRKVNVRAGDVPKLREAILRAREKFGLGPEVAVHSCYEAGRDGSREVRRASRSAARCRLRPRPRRSSDPSPASSWHPVPGASPRRAGHRDKDLCGQTRALVGSAGWEGVQSGTFSRFLRGFENAQPTRRSLLRVVRP